MEGENVIGPENVLTSVMATIASLFYVLRGTDLQVLAGVTSETYRLAWLDWICTHSADQSQASSWLAALVMCGAITTRPRRFYKILSAIVEKSSGEEKEHLKTLELTLRRELANEAQLQTTPLKSLGTSFADIGLSALFLNSLGNYCNEELHISDRLVLLLMMGSHLLMHTLKPQSYLKNYAILLNVAYWCRIVKKVTTFVGDRLKVMSPMAEMSYVETGALDGRGVSGVGGRIFDPVSVEEFFNMSTGLAIEQGFVVDGSIDDLHKLKKHPLWSVFPLLHIRDVAEDLMLQMNGEGDPIQKRDSNAHVMGLLSYHCCDSSFIIRDELAASFMDGIPLKTLLGKKMNKRFPQVIFITKEEMADEIGFDGEGLEDEEDFPPEAPDDGTGQDGHDAQPEPVPVRAEKGAAGRGAGKGAPAAPVAGKAAGRGAGPPQPPAERPIVGMGRARSTEGTRYYAGPY